MARRNQKDVHRSAHAPILSDNDLEIFQYHYDKDVPSITVEKTIWV